MAAVTRRGTPLLPRSCVERAFLRLCHLVCGAACAIALRRPPATVPNLAAAVIAMLPGAARFGYDNPNCIAG